MSHETGDFLSGYLLDGEGGCRKISSREIESWKPEDGLLWIHVDRGSEVGRRWLSEGAGLPAIVCDALVKEEVRPRCLAIYDGILVVLRGVNLNPGRQPEDMVSLRLWVEQNRIVDLRHRKLRELSEVRDKLGAGVGPCRLGDLVLELADTMLNGMEPAVDHLEEEIDEMETGLSDGQRLDQDIRAKLSSIRRRTIRLRRYLSPQRDALARLRVEQLAWMEERHKQRLGEIIERLTHIIEDLDWVREHTGVAQDEFASLQTEEAGRNMYRLSIIAAILLPPSLIAGLLGANVSGIPMSHSPWGFPALCLAIATLAALEFWLLRRFRWI
ncbi:MAG: zinc transporter ZntB [Arenicellales bacterium]